MKPVDPDSQSAVAGLLSGSGLPRHLRMFSWLSSSVALCENHFMRFFIELALDEGITVLRVKEIILQNYLFCGFPNTIEGSLVLSRILHERGLKDENYSDARNDQEILKDGLELCQKIYGKNYDKLIRNIGHMSSDLSRWMLNEGYGKVLSRPILTPLEREMAVISSLAVLRRKRQLISHIRGAAHVGAGREEIAEVFSSLSLVGTQDLVDESLAILKETLK